MGIAQREPETLAVILPASPSNFGLIITNYVRSKEYLWATSKCCSAPIGMEWDINRDEVSLCWKCGSDTEFNHPRTGVALCDPSSAEYDTLLNLVAHVYGLDEKQRETLQVTFA